MSRGWDNAIASQLDLIHAALRQVVSVSEWVDANGAPFTPDRNLNLISMRAPWTLNSGSVAGVFDIWQQAVVFPSNGQGTVQTNSSGRNLPWSTQSPRIE